MFPGSQKAFLSFFLMSAAESSRSILLSASEDDILAPVKPEIHQYLLPQFLPKTPPF